MKGLISDTYLKAIADAIRSKTGKSAKIKVADMASEIGAIITDFKTQSKTVQATKQTLEISPDTGFNGLSKVTINPYSILTQTKTITPSKSTQEAKPDSNYDGLSKVTVNPIPSEYIIPVGSQNITENKTYDVKALAEVVVNVPTSGGSAKNIQCYHGYATVSATSYTATAVSLTVAKTGVYKVSWMGYRSTNSGTSGSQLYIGTVAYGSANTSFVNTYGQSVVLDNVSLTQGQTITVRARARSTSYVMGVGNLCIEEK